MGKSFFIVMKTVKNDDFIEVYVIVGSGKWKGEWT